MSNYKNIFDPNQRNTSWNIAFRFVPDGAKVLEIGCGNGYFAAALKKYKKCHVTGVEPDDGDARIAKKQVDRLIHKRLEEALPLLQTEKYDCIIFLDVIEHLVQPADLLKNMSTLLRKGGVIIFSVPNMNHISIRLRALTGSIEYGETGILDKTHLHFYNDKELNLLFQEAGYALRELKGVVSRYSDFAVRAYLLKHSMVRLPKGFMKALHDNDGDVYQYVGVAAPGKGTGKRVFCSPDTKDDVDEGYEAAIKYLKEQLALAEATVKELKEQK